MENASKALLIAGAILLAILIIAIGMFIYNSSQSTITNSMNSLNTQEINAFNNQFVAYEDAQTGSNLKSLIGILISNSNTYKDERGKIPTVGVAANQKIRSNDNTAYKANRPADTEDTTNYVKVLSKMRNQVETKHVYWIEMNSDTSGLISTIEIYYTHANLGTGNTSK